MRGMRISHPWSFALLGVGLMFAVGSEQIASAAGASGSRPVYGGAPGVNTSQAIPFQSSTPLAPGQVLDLGAWKLQLPAAALPPAVNEAIIFQPALANYTSPFFYTTNNSTSVEFVCNAGGVTTGGSHFPRTELAQRHTWATGGSTTYTMSFTGAVQRLTPVRPVVVIAQIFGATGVLLQIRVTGSSKGTQILAAPMSPLTSTVLASTYKLGVPYAIRLTGGNGVICVYYGTGATTAAATYPVSGMGLGTYFKAGNYLQSNNRTYTELGTATSEVSMYTLTMS